MAMVGCDSKIVVVVRGVLLFLSDRRSTSGMESQWRRIPATVYSRAVYIFMMLGELRNPLARRALRLSSSLYTCLYPDKDTLTWFHPVFLTW